MKKGNEVFVGIDTTHTAVAVAEAGRDAEVRYLGTFDNTPDAVVRLVRKLAGRHEALHFCCEAGSTGHGLYRQILPRHGAKTFVFDPWLSRNS
jgi:transposase